MVAQSAKWIPPVLAMLLMGCADLEGDVGADGVVDEDALTSENGLWTVNGLASANGLMTVNGLMTANGLMTVNGLSSTTGLMTTAAGRKQVEDEYSVAVGGRLWVEQLDRMLRPAAVRTAG